MGAKQSCSVILPTISKDQWNEQPLHSTYRRKTSHGLYKLYSNIITNQKIEQYSLTFQNQQQRVSYVESFLWRQRDEHIVNAKYFQKEEIQSFCGSRSYAKVYLEHIPFRLSSISDIPLPQNIYVLLSVLAGFQKLYSLIGYFKTNQDMIGIDCQGRVKVWFNTNFSQNYLYGPYYVEGIANPEGEDRQNNQQKMVWEIIQLVESSTCYQNEELPSITNYFLTKKNFLNFNFAISQIKTYAKIYNLEMENYFVSFLNLFQENQSEKSEPSENIRSPEKDNKTERVIYFIDPAFAEINGLADSPVKLKQQNTHLTKLEQEFVDLPRASVTTGQTNLLKPNTTSLKNHNKQAALHKNLVPKINFKYSTKQISTGNIQPKLSQRSPCHDQINLNSSRFNLPLSRIAQNLSQESRGNTRRMMFSDIHSDYQLDDQLAQDMVKYLNG